MCVPLAERNHAFKPASLQASKQGNRSPSDVPASTDSSQQPAVILKTGERIELGSNEYIVLPLHVTVRQSHQIYKYPYLKACKIRYSE